MIFRTFREEVAKVFSEIVNPIHTLFNSETVRKYLFASRYPMVFGCFVFLLFAVDPNWFFIGFLVASFGEWIQVWSFGCLEKNTTLAVKGPYMIMRNPMYLGRYFLLAGCLLTTGYLWGVPLLTALYYFYAVNRVKREERRLLGLFGDAYKNYCRKVKRFVPSLKAFEKGSFLFFKWELLVKNHGLQNLAAMLGCFTLLYVFAYR